MYDDSMYDIAVIGMRVNAVTTAWGPIQFLCINLQWTSQLRLMMTVEIGLI